MIEPKEGELPAGAVFARKPFSADVVYDRLQEIARWSQAGASQTTLCLSKGLPVPLGINLAISRGDAPVFPGDVLLGDGDGVMVIPAHLADEIAEECAGMESFEDFVLEQVNSGASIIGLYPATNDQVQADYAEWRKREGR